MTPEWLAGALELPVDAVPSYTLEPIGAGRGLSGVLARLTFEREPRPGWPRSTVVKLMPWAREATFYREFAPQSGAPAPAVYFTAVEPPDGPAVVVIEDLTGCVFTEPGAASVGLLAAAARTAARMHARWWADPSLPTRPWLNTPEGRTARFPPVLRARLARPHPWFEALPAEVRSLAALLPDALEGGIYLDTGPRTFVHGDLGPRNIALRPDGTVVFLDWELCGTDTPGWDLAQLVSDGCGQVPAAEAVDLVLSEHHAALLGAGVAGYSMANLERAFAVACLRALSSPLGILEPGVDNPLPIGICERWMDLFTVMMARVDYHALLRRYAASARS